MSECNEILHHQMFQRYYHVLGVEDAKACLLPSQISDETVVSITACSSSLREHGRLRSWVSNAHASGPRDQVSVYTYASLHLLLFYIDLSFCIAKIRKLSYLPVMTCCRSWADHKTPFKKSMSFAIRNSGRFPKQSLQARCVARSFSPNQCLKTQGNLRWAAWIETHARMSTWSCVNQRRCLVWLRTSASQRIKKDLNFKFYTSLYYTQMDVLNQNERGLFEWLASSFSSKTQAHHPCLLLAPSHLPCYPKIVRAGVMGFSQSANTKDCIDLLNVY